MCAHLGFHSSVLPPLARVFNVQITYHSQCIHGKGIKQQMLSKGRQWLENKRHRTLGVQIGLSGNSDGACSC